MINYGKNINVLAGNFQKTISFAARLLDTLFLTASIAITVQGLTLLLIFFNH